MCHHKPRRHAANATPAPDATATPQDDVDTAHHERQATR